MAASFGGDAFARLGRRDDAEYLFNRGFEIPEGYQPVFGDSETRQALYPRLDLTWHAKVLRMREKGMATESRRYFDEQYDKIKWDPDGYFGSIHLLMAEYLADDEQFDDAAGSLAYAAHSATVHGPARGTARSMK